MGPGKQGRVSPQLLHVLAGIETGVLGGMAMLGWLILASVLERQPVWVVPTLLGSVVYRYEVLRSGFGVVTLAGLALQFCIAGGVGLVFGVLAGDTRNRLRVVLLGVLAALAWYYISQALFWRRVGVFVGLYLSPRSLVVAHLFYGLTLGLYPGILSALRRQFEGEPADPAGPAQPQPTAGPVE